MRILYLHQYYRTPAEGGGVRSYHIGQELARQGHEVHVITTWDGPVKRVTREGRLLVTYLPIAYSNHMGKADRIRAFLRFVFGSYTEAKAWLPADRVFATSTPLTIGLTALLLKYRHRLPYVFEVRDAWPEAPIQLGFVQGGAYKSLLRWLERRIYAGAEKLLALSPGMADHVRRNAPAKEVLTIPNFSDTAFFRPEEARIRGSQFHIVYAGSFGYANDVSRLLNLALAARDARLPVHFTLAGDGSERAAAEAFVTSHDLRHTVDLLPHLSSFGVRDLLARADAAYVGFRPEPILQTNSPNKFFDALGAGVPILLGVQGWLADLVQEEGAGIVLTDPAQDLEALRQLLAADSAQMRETAGRLAARFEKEALVSQAITAILGA